MRSGAEDPQCEPADRALYAATDALVRELGSVMSAAFRAGEDAQRAFLDIAFDAAEGSVAPLLARVSECAGQAQETAAVFSTADALDLAWQQGRNNFEVYSLVRNVQARLGVDWTREVDLGEAVRHANALGAYPDLWAIEGLGHDYTIARLDQGVSVGILRDGAAAALPASSLTMMHAGLGLALAERAVPRVNPCSTTFEVRDAIAQFVTACDANARDGYAGAAYESLGLYTRTWYAHVVDRVDAVLPHIRPGLADYFWHGAGRALYFLPAYIVPGLLSPWRAADREAPHELARANLYAGLAWATTLVNMRQPRIMLQLLRVRADRLSHTGAFAAGVAAAIVVAIDTTPGHTDVMRFAAYDPMDADERTRDAWGTLVRRPAVAALERYHPVLAAHRQLDRVFRYEDLEALMGQLDRNGHA
jgi:hypothetical protein